MGEPSVPDTAVIGYVKRFWLALVSIAGVIGLYEGAASIHQLLYFWVTLGAAVVFAGTPPAFKRIRESFKRYTNYPKLLQEAGRLKNSNEELEQTNKQLVELAEKRREEGIAEGRAELLGSLYSLSLEKLPVLKATSNADGALSLIADYDPSYAPKVGTRFGLIAAATRETKGVVEVRRLLDNPPEVWMVCIRADVAAFWERLADEATLNSEVPRGLVLKRLEIPGWTQQQAELLYANPEGT